MKDDAVPERGLAGQPDPLPLASLDEFLATAAEGAELGLLYSLGLGHLDEGGES
ncbi:hypothetical protein [Streptomyces sp. CC224B]|uniref:hypothetical protein n=1 Tax=Streptomyces sp. CC224B TaxID=3044571 RepID=UPI0024A9C967|nr:hypothetical protein [Streptomyces sp. CC224B]